MSPRFDKRSGNSSRSGGTGRGRFSENGRTPRRDHASRRKKNDIGQYRPMKRRDGRDSDSSIEDDGFKDRSKNPYAETRGPSRRANPRNFNKRDQILPTKEDRLGKPSLSRGRTPVSREGTSSGSRYSAWKNDSGHPPEVEMFGTPSSDDLLWGRHATQAALESGRPIHRIWCTSELRSSAKFLQLLRDAKSSGVLVEEVTWSRLAQLTGGAVHQGIVLQTAASETLDLTSLVKGCSSLGESPLLLALDGLTDPQNLGAIVRSAEALGAHGLVIPQRRSAGLTGSVAKVAAGALEHLPVARVVNLNRSLETLKKSGYRVIGLAEEGDQTLPEIDLDGPLVVVIGSEDKGLSLLTRRHCDHLVRIPLRGVTPSLNASVATAMFLYEVARRGWMKDLKGQAPSPRIERVKCSQIEKSKEKEEDKEDSK